MTNTERTARKREQDAQQTERRNALLTECSNQLLGAAWLLKSLRQPITANACLWVAERAARAAKGEEIGPDGQIESVALTKAPAGFGPEWKHPLQIEYEQRTAKRNKANKLAYGHLAKAGD